MENSFAAQLFKNLLWTRVRGGGCRESVLKGCLGTLKHWTGIMEINHPRCSLRVARASPAHPSRSHGRGAAGVLLPLARPPASRAQPWRGSSSALLDSKTKGM